jgi:hypothetical protein
MASLFDFQNQDYSSLGQYGSGRPLMEIPGVTTPGSTAMVPMSADRVLPSDRSFLYGDMGYGGMGGGFSANPVPSSDSSTWGAGSGLMGQFNSWLQESGALGSRLSDGTQMQGWGGLALGGLSSAANLFMGMQQYGLAKQQLAFQKDAFNKNYAAQRTATNSALEDRQRARVASNGSAYESVDSYMARNSIK